ncbi:MAG TPA: transcription antitermination factor NusB, partial [Nitriliruptorales bacterium]|nr:transcription antitermination factor NusB [Nitriliruptorales bacterium]
MAGPGVAARRAALDALTAVDERDAYSNLAVPVAVADLADARDRALASHLAYDTLRWEGTLDWALAHVIDRDLADVEPVLRRVLRLGALQLLRTDVPPRAAVSTAVALARGAVPGRRARGAAGFVNGVLRALARRVSDLPWPAEADDPVGHLVLTTAHPAWIVTELRDRLGGEARAALEGDNRPPGLTLRATADRAALLAELHAEGIDATPGQLAPEAVHAPGADPRRLAAVTAGRALPQDEASMLVAHATRVRSGDRVLDMCAGPGGKSTHLAALVGPTGEVTAVELHPHRARLIEDTAARVGVPVQVVVGDATDPPVSDGYDAVLVDAPCTGLGTGRCRPEVR